MNLTGQPKVFRFLVFRGHPLKIGSFMCKIGVIHVSIENMKLLLKKKIVFFQKQKHTYKSKLELKSSLSEI